MKKPRRRFSPKVYAEIIQRQQGICACGCQEELGDDPREIQFDHERELWDDGEDTPENLRAVIRKHHLAKSARGRSRQAKLERIKDRKGLRLPKMTKQQKLLAKHLEAQRP